MMNTAMMELNLNKTEMVNGGGILCCCINGDFAGIAGAMYGGCNSGN